MTGGSSRRAGGRTQAAALHTLVAVGVALALSLGIAEARRREPLTVGHVVETRRGRVVTVVGDVTNHSDWPRCPDVRAAARDREARDLAEVRARPATGPGRVLPGRTVRYRAVLATLTTRDVTERLDRVTMFVYRSARCP